MKEGVIFGYLAIAEFGSFSDGLGHAYNFGRTALRDVVSMRRLGSESDVDWADRQKDALKRRMKRSGLNTPSRVLLWVNVEDLEQTWDELVEHLRGFGSFMSSAGTAPLIAQQLQLGDNWYTVENLNSEDFGRWCRNITELIVQAADAAVVVMQE